MEDTPGFPVPPGASTYHVPPRWCLSPGSGTVCGVRLEHRLGQVFPKHLKNVSPVMYCISAPEVLILTEEAAQLLHGTWYPVSDFVLGKGGLENSF